MGFMYATALILKRKVPPDFTLIQTIVKLLLSFTIITYMFLALFVCAAAKSVCIGILTTYGPDTLAVVVLFTHAAFLQHVLVLGHDGRYPNGGSSPVLCLFYTNGTCGRYISNWT